MTDDPNASGMIPMRSKAQSRGARVAFIVAAAIGALILLTEVGLHIASTITDREFELNHGILLIGILFGFVGFYGLDPKRARDGAGFAVDQTVKVINALPRFGRRKSDAVAVPGIETRTTPIPTPPLAPPGDSHGSPNDRPVG